MHNNKKQKLVKGAVTTGITNGIINGGIQYFFLKGMAPIAISVDSITNTEHTVLGTAVVLAVTLAMILTVVSYFGIKEEKVPFFPSAFGLVLKHGFFTFGVVTALAVLWQRYLGTIEVSLLSALIIIGVIAGIIAGFVEYLTIKACIRRSDEA
ncbi:MAG TPA: hypothetical protein VK112_00435 [Fodinibius sp.]|nr:hypothetical protein [Fodinibius sp.]